MRSHFHDKWNQGSSAKTLITSPKGTLFITETISLKLVMVTFYACNIQLRGGQRVLDKFE